MRIAFVCVQNAGRSQMATAFAEREVRDRQLDDIEIITGGTMPAEEIHPEVQAVMSEVDASLADRSPQSIDESTLETSDLVVTMGCSTLNLDANVTVRDWDLPDPHNKSPDRVREIRELVQEWVAALFDEIAENTMSRPSDPRD